MAGNEYWKFDNYNYISIICYVAYKIISLQYGTWKIYIL